MEFDLIFGFYCDVCVCMCEHMYLIWNELETVSLISIYP
jgi:hypothetical protein